MFFQLFIFVTILVGIDQWTKYLAVAYLKPIDTTVVIPKIIDFTFVENRGAAFGILQNQRWFFIIMTIIVVIGILFYYHKLPQEKPYGWVRLSLLLIIAGAIGNFIDRVRQGFVIDFFHVRFIEFPVFNMADIYVVCGTILLAILLLFVIKDPEEKGI